MDDDVDIYGDLPNFNTNECSTCKERAKEFTEKSAKLEKEISLWKGKCENFEREKKIILTNTSSLMKTARAEIDRKDRTIIELRRELEDVKFRRGVWSKSKTNQERNHHKSKEKKPHKKTKRYEKEFSIVKVEIPSTNDESAWKKCEEVEEDPEQKWDPACQNFTVYGERLRKKLLEEQEAERVRKEEAKNAESKNSAACSNQTVKPADQRDSQVPCPLTEKILCIDIKVEEEMTQEEESKPVPLDDTQSMQVEEKQLAPIESSIKLECESDKYFEELSEEGELSESSDTQSGNFDRHRDENRQRDDRSEELANRRYDHKNELIDRNLNFNHNLHHNLRHKARNRSENCRAFGYSDKMSHRQSNPTRQHRDLRNECNYQSRSRPPDRKYQKTKGGYRSEKPRDHFDKYEKRREDRLTRDTNNYMDYNKKDNYDRREKFDRKHDDRFFFDSRNDHDINYDSDHKRPAKSRSPGQVSRSKSSSSRSSQNDGRRNERSRSRGRSNSKNNIESEKDRVDRKRKSRDRKICSEDRVNNDSQTIQRVSESLRSFSKENVKSGIPEESIIKNHHESREKSKSTSSHHNDGRLHESSKFHESLDTENKEEFNNDSKEKKIELENREIVSEERGKKDPKKIEPMPEPSSSNLEENSKNTISTNLNSTNFEESREKVNDNAQGATVSSEKIVNLIDTRDKFILMLENDCEVALSPITRREIEAIGSRSFREEKIENIEKFIQDYQEDANHCSLLGTDIPPEQEEENKLGNSTSSIVDTLSMDVDDLEKERDSKITEISENSDNPRFQNSGINKESEEKSIDKKLKVDAIKGKDENSKLDIKVDKTRSTENSRDVFLDKKLIEPAISKEKEKAVVSEKIESLSVSKTLETSAVENKIVKVVDKLEKIATEEKKNEIVDNKIEGRDKQSENMSSDKKTKRSTRSNKLHHSDKDRKTIEKTEGIDERKSKKEHKKLEKDDGNEKLPTTESIDRRTENKGSEEKSFDTKTGKKLESIEISEKTDTIKRKCEENVSLDNKLKNVNLGKTCDIEDDKKLENVVEDPVSTNAAIDKNSGTVEPNKESKTVEIKEPEKTVSKIAPPLPFLPPIPPSPPPTSLPPLPLSPPPEEEKKVELSVEKIVPTVEEEAKILQTEKTTSKQIKNRPRIPCLPIVSLYSRKRRGMVLTDSTSSHTIVSSLKSTKGLENVKESSIVKETSKIELKKVLTRMETIEASILNETRSEKSTDELIIAETEQKIITTLVEDPNSKNDNKIVSKTRNSSLDRDEPEVNSSPTVATLNENIKSKDESATGSSLTIKNVEKIAKDVEDKVGETQEEVNTINNSESKNSDTNSTSSKSVERATRSVLKTIASTTGSTDSGSSNRKRPLSKEKENQSKPPKQTKIMIITRRRPVRLEDSSTVTTLVSSVSDDSSKDKKVKSSQKNVATGRIRRVA